MGLLCFLGIHDWDGCRCTKCSEGTRDEYHDYDNISGLCKKCGSKKETISYYIHYIPSSSSIASSSSNKKRGTMSKETKKYFGKSKPYWRGKYGSQGNPYGGYNSAKK
ncbi:MAG: hypothetical protein HQK63_16415 [Desulfamplus sp.]|nr:hypothetical protein [Desulfamplus sp.]